MIDEKALEAAVTAYDGARCAVYHDKPMSDRNRQSITPMIGAAITAYLSAATRAENAQVQIGQAGVTDGVEWFVVPKVATTRQLAAGQTAWLADPQRRSSTLYTAMLAAAGGENA